MKKNYLTLVFVSLAFTAISQTNPSPFDLSGGNYSFTVWDSINNAPGTYPPNMIFHNLNQQSPDENTPASGDWLCGYNFTSGCYFKGHDTLGVGFRNVSAAQSASCNSDTSSFYVGDATLSLNTTNRENISISWVGRMISGFNYDTTAQITRFWGIACQYRISDTAVFTNMPTDYLFKCNSDSVTYKPQFFADTLNSILPPICNNVPIVEIRWIYHQLAQNNGGPRPELALDDINISSTSIPTNFKKMNLLNKNLSIYPNPIGHGSINLSKSCNFGVYDILGHQVSAHTGNDFNTDSLTKGLYFIKTTDGEMVRFIKY